MALATLSIDLVAKLAQLEQDMGAAARITEKNAAAMQRAFDKVGTAVAGLGIGAAVASQIGQIRAAIDRLDGLDDLAEKTGVAASTLSGFNYAAEIAGTTSEDLANGLSKLAKNMAGAAAGGKEQAAAFRSIGVEIKNADGSLRGTDEVLLDVAQRFASYENGAGKAARAQELFGKNGEALIPVLNRGRDGIRELVAEAERLGIVMSDEGAAAAGEFNDNLKRLEMNAQGLSNALAQSLLPTLVSITNQLLEGRKAYGSFLSALVDVGFNIDPMKSMGDNISLTVQQLQKSRLDLAEMEERANRIASGNASIGDRFQDIGGDRQRAKLKEQIALLEKRFTYLQRTKSLEDGTASVPSTGGSGSMPPTPKGDDAAARKAEQVEKAYRKLMETIEQRGALAQAELANNAALDEADRFRIDTLAKANLAENGFSDAMRKRLSVAAEAAARDIEAVQIRERLRKLADEQAAAEQANIRALESALDAQASQNRTLREQLDTFGLTAEQVERLRIARLQDALAVEQGEIAIAKAMGVGGAELELMREKAGLLEQEIGMRQQLAGRTEALQQDPLAGAGKGVSDYLDEIARAGDATRQAVGGAMRSLEDDLTQSLATGQLTVQRTVDMMISEFMRLALVRPLMQALTGGMSSFFGFAKGGAFDSAGVVPFAAGGVFDSPHLFRFADGAAMRTGVLGEAGPEAIMPLRRGPDGKLGVVARGGGGSPVIHQTIHNRIDGSTDRAVIQSMVQEGVQQGMRAVMETLRNRGVLA